MSNQLIFPTEEIRAEIVRLRPIVGAAIEEAMKSAGAAPIDVLWVLVKAMTFVIDAMGHDDIAGALALVFQRKLEWPRVPNPANPAEDYADKWALNPNLERSFWSWHTQVRADLRKLAAYVSGESLRDDVVRTFGVVLSEEQLQPFGVSRPDRAPAIVRTPVVTIPKSAPRPWGGRYRI